MTEKKTKRILTLTGIVTVAALSLTSKMDLNVPKNNYNTKIEPKISIIDSTSSSSKYNMNVFSNLIDTILARQKDYETLDSLLFEARKMLSVPLVYHEKHLDSLEINRINSSVNEAITRPMINQEALVNSILDTTKAYTEVVDKYFIKASIREESMYTPKALSPTGAKGLMQFTRSAWKHFGEGQYLPNVYNPEKNIRAGLRYYRWMEEEFSNKHPQWDKLTIAEKRDLLSAGYNGGPYSIMSKKVNWNINNMRDESIKHVAKVNAAIEQFQTEELYKNIASYRAKIERHELGRENVFWLAYDAANTGAFMNNYIYKTKSNSIDQG